MPSHLSPLSHCCVFGPLGWGRPPIYSFPFLSLPKGLFRLGSYLLVNHRSETRIIPYLFDHRLSSVPPVTPHS
ncbi:hypothetical protein IE53DRAFT_383986 [Violaceomyces palustris]|uniref:Uncharacterized protein n=1 Tax=Violaceomyces palustris TaxID=1673888 RepID=A0ACD0P611_9BASI|nr:hypothetical protein IE53DRAFT_383986 [Violaceomyces palustris]